MGQANRFTDEFKAAMLPELKRALRESMGGMKMVELLCAVMHENSTPIIKMALVDCANFVSLFDAYLKALEPEGIHVLTYDYDMGGVIREKQFVYTKVKPK